MSDGKLRPQRENFIDKSDAHVVIRILTGGGGGLSLVVLPALINGSTSDDSPAPLPVVSSRAVRNKIS